LSIIQLQEDIADRAANDLPEMVNSYISGFNFIVGATKGENKCIFDVLAAQMLEV